METGICLEYNAYKCKIYHTAVLKLVLMYCHNIGLNAFIEPCMSFIQCVFILIIPGVNFL